VLGGGPAGLAAAEEAARCGVPVTLVERSDRLGGRLRGRALTDPAAAEELAALAERVSSSPGVDVLTGARVAEIERASGGFRATIRGGAEEPLPCGAVIVAAENEDYDPAEYEDLKKAAVLTQAELALRLMDAAPEARSVVMIQCVGSRTPERPYCSRTCCVEALANALRLRELAPDVEIAVLHQGVRVWGFDEEMFSDAIDLGVRFVRVDGPPTVTPDGGLEFDVADGEEVDGNVMRPDLVVLSAGVRSSAANRNAAGALSAELDDDGFFAPADGALAPLESGLPRVYFCGPACGPVGVREGAVQARAAAGKACRLLMKGIR